MKNYSLNILSALSEIHRNNVIHGDIKPDNFLLFRSEDSLTSYENRDNQSDIDDEEDYEENERLVKLTDFGLSHIISNGNFKAYMKHPLGTYGYIAPEVKSVINIFIIRIVMLINLLICGHLELVYIKWLLHISPLQ